MMLRGCLGVTNPMKEPVGDVHKEKLFSLYFSDDDNQNTKWMALNVNILGSIAGSYKILRALPAFVTFFLIVHLQF
ncbi:unnamed protein product [Allacma fusca]|uniref:Uncharacterized protein n=1 Tax=Allacma fusca TaxID=39272 RepID=A0A8J2K4Y3_9HEXA|nr:unnamed protein product [Allacma fusca]